jgi:VWFA-related protein
MGESLVAKRGRVSIVYKRMLRLSVGTIVACGVLVLAPVAGMWAQEAETPPAKTITVIPDAVTLAVAVRDKKGQFVKGLTKDDFVLSVRDKAQTIQSVTQSPDEVMTIGLVVDVSSGLREKMPTLLDDERSAAKGFFAGMLKPGTGSDAAGSGFVVHFAKQTELLQDVTNDEAKLDKALQELGTESAEFKTKTDPDSVDSEGRKVRGGGTALYDSLFLSGDELMAKQRGRKVVVLLTDGVDVGSKESLTEAIEAMQRANTTVYAIYVKGTQHFDQQMGNPNNRRSGGYPGGGGGYPGGGYPGGGYPGGGYPGGSPGGNPGGGGSTPNRPGGTSRKPLVDGRQVLERLCGETGGRVFELSKRMDMGQVYQQIAEELRAEYRLVFVPDAAAARYGLHPIDLEMKDAEKNKKLDIQTRSGYYAGDAK